MGGARTKQRSVLVKPIIIYSHLAKYYCPSGARRLVASQPYVLLCCVATHSPAHCTQPRHHTCIYSYVIIHIYHTCQHCIALHVCTHIAHPANSAYTDITKPPPRQPTRHSTNYSAMLWHASSISSCTAHHPPTCCPASIIVR